MNLLNFEALEKISSNSKGPVRELFVIATYSEDQRYFVTFNSYENDRLQESFVFRVWSFEDTQMLMDEKAKSLRQKGYSFVNNNAHIPDIPAFDPNRYLTVNNKKQQPTTESKEYRKLRV